jgi:uridine kinase
MSGPIIVGIAGGSGSGKSTVRAEIVRGLGAENVAVVDVDAYYRDLSHLPFDERVGYNFDHPDAIDIDIVAEHVDLLAKGVSVDKPVYDFVNHVRTADVVGVAPRPIVLVEGILVLAYPFLVSRMDVKLFVDAEPDVRLARRIRRDVAERGRTVESILDMYEATVQPMHALFVEPSKKFADVVIPRGGRNDVAIQLVLALLRDRIARAAGQKSIPL